LTPWGGGLAETEMEIVGSKDLVTLISRNKELIESPHQAVFALVVIR
jgi:hypothetical protein